MFEKTYLVILAKGGWDIGFALSFRLFVGLSGALFDAWLVGFDLNYMYMEMLITIGKCQMASFNKIASKTLCELILDMKFIEFL